MKKGKAVRIVGVASLVAIAVALLLRRSADPVPRYVAETMEGESETQLFG